MVRFGKNYKTIIQIKNYAHEITLKTFVCVNCFVKIIGTNLEKVHLNIPGKQNARQV